MHSASKSCDWHLRSGLRSGIARSADCDRVCDGWRLRQIHIQITFLLREIRSQGLEEALGMVTGPRNAEKNWKSVFFGAGRRYYTSWVSASAHFFCSTSPLPRLLRIPVYENKSLCSFVYHFAKFRTGGKFIVWPLAHPN